jgi:hypothetical protein
MAEIKGDLRYLQIPLGYLRNTVAELIKNQYDLLFYYVGYLIFFYCTIPILYFKFLC